MRRPLLKFGGFTLDAENAYLHSDGIRVSLSPKDCALLQRLAANAGRVLSHAELLSAVWGDTAVGPDVLKVRVARLRRLLGDDAHDPRFIANVHGEGYRFLPQQGTERDGFDLPRTPRPLMVGRTREQDALKEALAAASAGRRQTVIVSGDAGIGKTTLIDGFVDGVGGASAWVWRGQCIGHYGSGEPYLPVMEALSRLGRDDRQGRLKRVLGQYAPSWLLQLPTLLDPAEREALQRRVVEPNRERMLRELAEALEALDASGTDGESPTLVLVLEDLHWADVSTLDLLQMLARRRERARLLILGSYRRLEETATSHSLRSVVDELAGRGTATQLALGPLDRTDVVSYLDERFPENRFPAQLAALIHQRTAGHPLFLHDLVRDLLTRQVLVHTSSGWAFEGDAAEVAAIMPASVQQLFARQPRR